MYFLKFDAANIVAISNEKQIFENEKYINIPIVYGIP